METRTYTERSNARRAARAAGLDPELSVIPTDEGFEVHFPDRTKEAFVSETGAVIDLNQSVAAHTPEPDLDGVPDFLKISPEQRKAAWDKNPPRAAAAKPKETITMPKTTKKPKKERGNGSDKNGTLLKMLKDGSTVDQLTKALDWLPHTLRARISRLNKPKSKGGEGLNIERSRTDKVTTYRIA